MQRTKTAQHLRGMRPPPRPVYAYRGRWLALSTDDLLPLDLVSLSRDIHANNTGGQIDSKSYTYTVNFTAAEDLSFTVGATKSDVLAGTTVVNTMVYNLGADYKYNPHLSFTLAYSFTDSKLPANASANFQANALTVSAAFRY